MIYTIKIETYDPQDFNMVRAIFDHDLTHPMNHPYRFEAKAINAWSRTININRDEEFIKEKNHNRLNGKIDPDEVEKFINSEVHDSSNPYEMIAKLMNGEYTIEGIRQVFLESDWSLY